MYIIHKTQLFFTRFLIRFLIRLKFSPIALFARRLWNLARERARSTKISGRLLSLPPGRREAARLCILRRSTDGTAASGEKRGRRRRWQVNQFLRAPAGPSARVEVPHALRSEEFPGRDLVRCGLPCTASNGLSIVRPGPRDSEDRGPRIAIWTPRDLSHSLFHPPFSFFRSHCLHVRENPDTGDNYKSLVCRINVYTLV